ncbi:calcium-binding protein, partial [Paracoccus sp. S-4012]|uniref:calcium-binding protein n=1 Tax=Paracoccus sp. S-4012 TaxID=2665648 RepID=UPI0013256959
GADTLNGGAGDDIYIVDNVGDRVNDGHDGGTDLVRASVSYALTANVENLTLTGMGNINGTGNGLANRINGNAGNNLLDGGLGADTLNGGAGDDIYIVDNVGDRVNDGHNGGTDLVRASVSYALTANVENLTLTGTGNISGTGNGLANRIFGNAGDNTLSGGAGADTLSGGAGDDLLVGGAGQDRLTGGAGADDFIFESVRDSATTGADIVQDFSRAQGDKIDLRLIDADIQTIADEDFVFIGEVGFSGNAGELRYDRVGMVTNISGDVDGDGRADFSISLIG